MEQFVIEMIGSDTSSSSESDKDTDSEDELLAESFKD